MGRYGSNLLDVISSKMPFYRQKDSYMRRYPEKAGNVLRIKVRYALGLRLFKFLYATICQFFRDLDYITLIITCHMSRMY